ncbi:uncharacterized protein BJ171DRAFT_292349 [Polychytrium aggregatum]|uniref:uncharacterized protein n=1 Tax=Polychytrium aggregatum TaxID=110093 RepID=UPI0022FEBED9|nr:uncharacterized protein BJ171DRAFT_292349 [Polychytrium aggregatum]KAI9207151.1 hypothetical protein BJ171DRAFT_292349 [Polychytrium aggregatum]
MIGSTNASNGAIAPSDHRTFAPRTGVRHGSVDTEDSVAESIVLSPPVATNRCKGCQFPLEGLDVTSEWHSDCYEIYSKWRVQVLFFQDLASLDSLDIEARSDYRKKIHYILVCLSNFEESCEKYLVKSIHYAYRRQFPECFLQISKFISAVEILFVAMEDIDAQLRAMGVSAPSTDQCKEIAGKLNNFIQIVNAVPDAASEDMHARLKNFMPDVIRWVRILLKHSARMAFQLQRLSSEFSTINWYLNLVLVQLTEADESESAKLQRLLRLPRPTERCQYCQYSVTPPYICQDIYVWHKNCFFCVLCGTSVSETLSSTFTDANRQVYCSNHPEIRVLSNHFGVVRPLEHCIKILRNILCSMYLTRIASSSGEQTQAQSLRNPTVLVNSRPTPDLPNPYQRDRSNSRDLLESATPSTITHRPSWDGQRNPFTESLAGPSTAAQPLTQSQSQPFTSSLTLRTPTPTARPGARSATPSNRSVKSQAREGPDHTDIISQFEAPLFRRNLDRSASTTQSTTLWSRMTMRNAQTSSSPPQSSAIPMAPSHSVPPPVPDSAATTQSSPSTSFSMTATLPETAVELVSLEQELTRALAELAKQRSPSEKALSIRGTDSDDRQFSRETSHPLETSSTVSRSNGLTTVHQQSSFSSISSADLPSSDFFMEDFDTSFLKTSSRGYAIAELLDSEAMYCNSLGVMLHYFKGGLLKSQIVKPRDADLIFRGIEDLYSFHKEFLTKLRTQLGPELWETESPRLGPVFLNYKARLADLLINFIDVGHVSYRTIKSYEKNQEYIDFMKAAARSEQTGKRDLKDFMVLPVQHSLRYCLLVKAVLKHTPDHDPDKQDLVLAVAAMEWLAITANEKKQESEELVGMFLAYEMTKHCPATLIQSRRRMMFRCDTSDVQRNRQVHLFLCSDSLLIAQSTLRRFVFHAGGQPPEGQPYSFVRWLDFRDIVFINDELSADTVKILAIFNYDSSQRTLTCPPVPAESRDINLYFRFDVGVDPVKARETFLKLLKSQWTKIKSA